MGCVDGTKQEVICTQPCAASEKMVHLLGEILIILTYSALKLQKKEEKAEGELKPVQEVPVKQSETDPKTDSGCVIS